MLEVRKLSFGYPSGKGKNLLFKEIGFTLHPGEAVALMGRNGSGKSTLLRCLAGFINGFQGSIDFKAKPHKSRSEACQNRGLPGFIFETPDTQLVAETVLEDIIFGPVNLGFSVSQREELLVYLLDKTGLAGLKDRDPAELSAGEKQLTVVAGIMAMKPVCILSDEATSRLDSLTAEKVISLFKEYCLKNGASCLHVTHSSEEAVLFERLIVLGEGKILHDGSPGEYFKDPARVAGAGLGLPFYYEARNAVEITGKRLPAGIKDLEGLVDFICG